MKAYRWWKRLGGLNGMKEGVQVAITRVVVGGVFDGVGKHGSEAGMVEPPHCPSSRDGVLASTEVLVKSVSYGAQYGTSHHVHVHELGLHEPRPEIDHGLDGSGVEVGRGAEELHGGYGREELLGIVEVEDGGGCCGWWSVGFRIIGEMNGDG